MNFWLCVSAAAIVIAGSYIIWGPSNRSKRKKKGVIPGLQNLGNSCFLNAVLQALSACPSVLAWLFKVVYYSLESQQDDKCILTKSLMSILSTLNENEDNCSGAEVIKALRAHGWIITNEEQDAHELFHVLTTTIEEEALALNPVLSLLDTKKLEAESEGVAEEHRKSFVSSMKTLPMRIASPIRGLLVNELKCNSCCYKYPARYDTFDSISLVIPTPNWGELTLQDLLLKFISCELVQDVVCDGCSNADSNPSSPDFKEKEKPTFNKQLSFGKLPKCLCIHIQRTVWLNNGIPVKCYDYISFPKVLIMDHFVHSHRRKDKQLGANYTRLRLTGGNSSKNDQTECATNAYSASQKISHSTSEISVAMNKSLPLNLTKGECLSSYNYVYLLKAVIVHQGDTSSGHFITYRRVIIDSENEKWFCVSDLDVKEVSFNEVSRSCAYMLFYEKIE